MRWLLRRLPLEQIIPVALAGAVFAFACGSSSVKPVQDVGRPLRWVTLFVLLGLSAGAVLFQRGRLRLPRSVLAAAGTLAAVALVSTLWSVDPRLTFERAATLALLLATVAALAQSSAGTHGGGDGLLYGLIAGAGAVAVAGLVVLAARHADAVQPATRDLPARYQGLGQNPNTVPLLLAPCLAIVVWLFMRTRSRRRRVVLAALALLFDGSIIASGSRGSLIAAFVGLGIVILFAPLRARRRILLEVVTAAALAASIGIALAPKSKGASWRPPPAAHTTTPGSHPNPGYTNVEGAFPLDSDIGTILVESKPRSRTLFGLTGRGEAWRGAIDLANQRPVAGYGFGTEALVFVDRWADFVGGLPENSYIGIYLQLGASGLISLGGLLVVLVVAALRRRHRWEVAGPAGALAAGLVLALVQSYLYSVGNVATLAVWTAAFVGAVQPLRNGVAT